MVHIQLRAMCICFIHIQPIKQESSLATCWFGNLIARLVSLLEQEYLQEASKNAAVFWPIAFNFAKILSSQTHPFVLRVQSSPRSPQAPTMIKAAIFLALLLATSACAVNWIDGQNWAFACDFPGNDIANALMQSSECGRACYNNLQCTHFTWTTYNGGLCLMKSGPMTKAKAVGVDDALWICGLIQ